MMESQALDQAARADAEIRRGHRRGPLHGVPYGAKDLFATKGVRTTWGAEPFQNQVPDYTATVIERLDNAGAVLLAKLSMGALAQGGQWFGGITKTPWAIDQTSSGSSAARHRPRPRVWWASPLEPKRWAPSSRRAFAAASRIASHLRPHQPLRRDGPELDHGQNWADVPLRGGLRPGARSSEGPRRP